MEDGRGGLLCRGRGGFTSLEFGGQPHAERARRHDHQNHNVVPDIEWTKNFLETPPTMKPDYQTRISYDKQNGHHKQNNAENIQAFYDHALFRPFVRNSFHDIAIYGPGYGATAL